MYTVYSILGYVSVYSWRKSRSFFIKNDLRRANMFFLSKPSVHIEYYRNNYTAIAIRWLLQFRLTDDLNDKGILWHGVIKN